MLVVMCVFLCPLNARCTLSHSSVSIIILLSQVAYRLYNLREREGGWGWGGVDVGDLRVKWCYLVGIFESDAV